MGEWADLVEEIFSYFMMVPFIKNASFSALTMAIFIILGIILLVLIIILFLGYKLKNGSLKSTFLLHIFKLIAELYL